MKKILVFLVALFLAASMAELNLAQAAPAPIVKKIEVKAESVRGKIISIDTKSNVIVLSEGKAGLEKTIQVTAALIASFKAGDNVKITLKNGSNIALDIVKIVKKSVPPVKK